MIAALVEEFFITVEQVVIWLLDLRDVGYRLFAMIATARPCPLKLFKVDERIKANRNKRIGVRII